MKQLDTQSREFLDCREELDSLERIAKKIGMFDADLHTAECVRYEMGLFASLELALFCQSKVYAWRTEKNPHYIDLIVMACKQGGVMPSPSLMVVIVEAATARFDGHPSGTPARILNDNFRGQAMNLMLNLVYAGDPLAIAASKAAQWHRSTFPDAKRQKASHLERLYSDQYRKTGAEQAYFDNWDSQRERRESKGWPQYWQKVREVLPMADDELTGNRRQ